MSNDHPPQGAAQRFIVEQMDLLLGRLEQLGRQIRDTVARIVGTTVAEAVSEAIRLAMRLVPQRKTAPSGRDEWRDSYDPYDDGYDQQYDADRDAYVPVPRPRWDWHGIVSRVIGCAMRTVIRLRRWRIGPWLPLGGAAALEYLLLTPPAETAG